MAGGSRIAGPHRAGIDRQGGEIEAEQDEGRWSEQALTLSLQSEDEGL